VNNPDIHAEISLRAARRGTAHGVAVWFDCELAEGIRFSNHPAAPERIYGIGFFPFLQPVDLTEGEHVTVQLAADLVNDGYVWRWDTEIPGKASFKQSTFFSVPLSTSQLRKSAQ
jgi:protein arginine N-methyltransferase 1